jgi:hypothetical protein
MKYDLRLLENVGKTVEHIGEIYDFCNSKELLEEWWWHLDKVASNELEVEIGIIQKNKVL